MSAVPRFPPDPVASRPADAVAFVTDGIALPTELDPVRTGAWLVDVAAARGRVVAALTYVLLPDDALHAMNVEYLGHDTLTDIITFDLGDGDGAPIAGECYVSLERVRDNAADLGEPPARELHRVLAHGLLHLCGLGDGSPAEAAAMRAAEREALGLLAAR